MAFFHRFKKIHVPELPTTAKWLQGGPVRLRDMKGRVACLVFFGYANMGCVRTFPFLHALQERYLDVLFVGIHVPEYAFEKDAGHVRAALTKYELSFPVLLDHAYETCERFHNQWLPRFFVLNTDGTVLLDRIGEGGHAEIEIAIQQALLTGGAKDLPPVLPDALVGGGVCYRTTPDTPLGYVHGSFIAKEGIVPHEEEAYTHVDKMSKAGIVGLHGHWKIEQEYIEHTRTLTIASEYFALSYSGFSVSLVAEPMRHDIEIMIDLDGKPIPQDLAGEDISYTETGQSMVRLDFPRAYRVINADTYHKGELKIRVKDADARFYSVLFGDCRGL